MFLCYNNKNTFFEEEMKKKRLRPIWIVILLVITLSFTFFVVKGFAALVNSRTFYRVLEFIPDLRYGKADNYETLNISKETPVDAQPDDIQPLVPNFDLSVSIGDDVESDAVILLCIDDGNVIASRNSKERMYPASMTKIMSLIVAVENIANVNKTFTMTYQITDPLYEQNATVMGMLSGETLPLIDILYGAILPSGADATAALAIETAGDEEGFVEMMNAKAEELGLIDTHFTNTSGLHDPDHYTTAHDMAIILDYALKNELCRKILTTEFYRTTATDQHPNGIEMYSTMFNKIHRDQIENVELVGGKTGYTYQAGHCLASACEKYGRTYIAVTGGGENKYSPIYDIMALFSEYI